MSRIIWSTILLSLTVLLGGCATSDSTLREQGHSDAYVLGFHDGRHSGMQEEGNYLEHYVKDYEKFATDREYAAGWMAGEMEGKSLQDQSQAVADGYTGYEIGQEADKASVHPKKITKDVMKGVDTSDFDKLGK